jgi:cell division protein FtsW (lipid II flippase)
MAQMANRPLGSLRRYRWREILLFILPIALLLLGMTQLLLAKLDRATTVDVRNLPVLQGLTPIFGLIAALIAAHVLLSVFFRKADQMLLPLVGLLSGLGVLMATRLGPSVGDSNQGNHQLLWVFIGLVICVGIVFGLRNIQWLSRFKYTVALVGVILFCTTLAQALRTTNFDSPTHDQLKLGPFAFQPSELFKVCIVIFFAAYLSENRDVLAESNWYIGKLRLPPLRQLGPVALMLGIGLVLFLFVRELGLALLTYGIFLSMLYFATGKLSFVLTSVVIAVGLGFVGYSLLSYVRARFGIVGFDVLHPPAYPATPQPPLGQHDPAWDQYNNYQFLVTGPYLQVFQGLIAISSGGIIGAGFGLGHPGLVPVVQSDMVLTAFGEELGLVGVFAILGLYLLLVYRGFHIAIRATDTFSQLLAGGLTSIFALQTLIISAGNLKLMPLTGIPLPFLSYGGSSIIGNFIIIGILLRISYNTRVEREGTP